MDTLLDRVVQWAEGKPRLIAHALAVYRRDHGLDDTALAALLDCAPEMLPYVALCSAPVPGSPDFDAEVADIAGYAGCAPDRLAALLAEPATARETA